MKILLLEDEFLLSRSICTYLLSRGHFVDAYDNGIDVLEAIEQRAHDFYILDINTPLLGGLECLETITSRYPHLPKIIISAYNDIDHITKAYALGCSDYLKKPFNLKELDIKIDKLSKIMSPVEPESTLIYLSKEYVFNKQTQQLLWRNTPHSFSKREHAMILLFISNIGQIITDELICTFVWDGESVQSSTIRSLINRIRSKLHEPLIENVRGFGYTLKRYAPA